MRELARYKRSSVFITRAAPDSEWCEANKVVALEAKLSKMREDLREADDRFDRFQDEFVQPYAALKIKLSKMEDLERLRDYVQARRNGKPEPGDYVMIPVVELDKALAGGVDECEHPNAISAKNEVVESGLYCPDCRTLISEIAEEA